MKLTRHLGVFTSAIALGYGAVAMLYGFAYLDVGLMLHGLIVLMVGLVLFGAEARR